MLSSASKSGSVFFERFSRIRKILVHRNFSSSINEDDCNYFEFGHMMIPHPEKAAKGGEDAFMANKFLLGVADGVGGWADHGVDPGLHSKTLCKNVTELSAEYIKKPEWAVKKLLIDAANKTKTVGSSTLVLLGIEKQLAKIKSAYIGDSGYILYRKIDDQLATIFQSPEQQKSFNFPYQIGTHGDSPNAAKEYEHDVQNNDIVVLGSDGLFDNLDDKQISRSISHLVDEENKINVTLAAETIASLAFKYSLNPVYPSPFSKKAKEARLRYNGGKSDDITVIVGQIKLKKSSS